MTPNQIDDRGQVLQLNNEFGPAIASEILASKEICQVMTNRRMAILSFGLTMNPKLFTMMKGKYRLFFLKKRVSNWGCHMGS